MHHDFDATVYIMWTNPQYNAINVDNFISLSWLWNKLARMKDGFFSVD